MSAVVFVSVLVAAALHASWNALVKGSNDKLLSMTAVVIGHVMPAALALLFVPAPDLACWPYLLLGAAFHLGYQAFLLVAYRIGDLTQVYPIARGSAPLIVTAVSIGLLGVALAPMQLTAVLVIAVGIMSLTLVRRADGLRNGRAAIAALITGCFIAGYSLSDGLGARVAGSPVAFYAWLSIFNAVIWALAMLVVRPTVLRDLATPRGRSVALVGGWFSFIAYAIVVWAFTLAPIPLVTALRETSIIFALLLGVLVLKERLDLARVVSAVVTLAGAALLRFAR
ncbi:MAG: DMT family transporter [Hyphomicrobiaceae bacterium]